jgi:hypothetical protein
MPPGGWTDATVPHRSWKDKKLGKPDLHALLLEQKRLINSPAYKWLAAARIRNRRQGAFREDDNAGTE